LGIETLAAALYVLIRTRRKYCWQLEEMGGKASIQEIEKCAWADAENALHY
jgi:hypothetical protein